MGFFILFILLPVLSLSSYISCALDSCLNTYNVSIDSCTTLTTFQQLIPSALSGPCAYMATKYLCTSATVEQLYQLNSTYFNAQDCNLLQYCFIEPTYLASLCNITSYFMVPNNTLIYDEVEATPFNQYFQTVMNEQPCPYLDRFAKVSEEEAIIKLKYMFGESFYYFSFGNLPILLSSLTLLDVLPSKCNYETYSFNTETSKIIFSGTVLYIFLVLVATVLYIIRRHHTPLKQRGIIMQLVNNLALMTSFWTVLEIDTFGYTASCGNVLIFANLALPMIAVTNLAKGVQLYLVYSWSLYKDNIDIKNKENLETALTSYFFRFRNALTEKGSLILILLIGFPVYLLFFIYIAIYSNDFKGSLISHSRCNWWTPSTSIAQTTLTPVPPLVPDLSSCQVCSFTNINTHVVPTLTLISLLAFLLLIIVIKVRRMRDEFHIWKELVIISLLNIIAYPIAGAAIYPSFYNALLDYKNKIDTPALMFSGFLLFNFIVSTLMPLYYSFQKKTLKVDIEKKILLSTTNPTDSNAHSSYLPPLKEDNSEASITASGIKNFLRNNFVEPSKNTKSLNDFIQDTKFKDKFINFCRSRFEGDIVNCYLKMLEIAKMPLDNTSRYHRSLEVYQAYFKPESPLCIPLLSSLSKDLQGYYVNDYTIYKRKVEERGEFTDAIKILHDHLSEETLLFFNF